jgi:long-chain acyl-CoA synthetase
MDGISDLLRRGAASSPRRPAVIDTVDDDRTLTWGEFDAAVSRAANSLIAGGCQPGDRVSLLLPTGVDFAIAYLAALRAGLVAVPLNPAYRQQEIDYIRADSGAGLHLDPDAARRLWAEGADGTDPRRDRGGEDISVLLYTSGTSGRPKGAMLSARALLANLEQLAAVAPPMLAADDTLFVPLPLCHVFGLNAGLGMALHVGATIVLADRFDAAATLDAMARHSVTAVLGVPGQYAQWLREPGMRSGFAGVRFAMSGSSTLSRAVVEGYRGHGITLHDGYGLTEAAPVVTVNALGRGPDGTVGRPLPGIEVQLRDADGSVVEDGDPGRIFIRGANLFSGYWPDGADGPGPDGWFGTGDVGVAEADGRLRLVGRTSELVIVNGFNVYPAEVEAVLAAAPGVGEVAVAGVRQEGSGEAVQAWVVPTPGSSLDPDRLLEAAARSLARFKLPERIHVVDALPHTVTGKIMKWQLDRKDDDAAP